METTKEYNTVVNDELMVTDEDGFHFNTIRIKKATYRKLISRKQTIIELFV
jgi:hypothetical protein